jgi:hypothetical protein
MCALDNMDSLRKSIALKRSRVRIPPGPLDYLDGIVAPSGFVAGIVDPGPPSLMAATKLDILAMNFVGA